MSEISQAQKLGLKISWFWDTTGTLGTIAGFDTCVDEFGAGI
jgi:hypothetical protein